ncbi:hypothetical protein, partial [Mesorhizobium sp.]|uniref:hypothetical protein n=1 Tax=Mesorhizobium sp. TaxID=1871066 RepID=UPI0025FC63DC
MAHLLILPAPANPLGAGCASWVMGISCLTGPETIIVGCRRCPSLPCGCRLQDLGSSPHFVGRGTQV